MSQIVLPQSQISYLSDGVSLRSWLLTTDHKRIAILYMISITVFFFLGGSAAALIRYNLIVPEGMIRSAETYNRLFTMHGIIMVWFFLVPAVPVTIGNFVVPLMLGARDLAFPKLNLASWYLFMAGGILRAIRVVLRRRRYRMDILYPAVQQLCPGPCRCGGHRHLHLRLFDHCHWTELHHHHPPPARPWPDLVSAAGVHLVAVFDQHHLCAGNPGAGDHAAAAAVRDPVPCRRIRSETGRRPAAVPAFVLVLLASRGLHHDPARPRRRVGDHSGVRPQGAVRLQVRRLGQRFHRGHRVSSSGATTCSSRDSRCSRAWYFPC